MTDSSHISIFQLVSVVQSHKYSHIKNVNQPVAVSFAVENLGVSFYEGVEVELFRSDHLAVVVHLHLEFRNTVSRRYNPLRMHDCTATGLRVVIIGTLKPN